MKPTHQPTQNTSFLDRLAVAWLSGVTAAITGGLFYWMWPGKIAFAEIVDIYIFVMSVIGFLLMENVVLGIFSWMLRFIFP